jgi:hypothetical protein
MRFISPAYDIEVSYVLSLTARLFVMGADAQAWIEYTDDGRKLREQSLPRPH